MEPEHTAGCFNNTSRRLLKRKHSDIDDEDEENDIKTHESIFTSLKEKFGFKVHGKADKSRKSILSSINHQDDDDVGGEHNMSYQHDDNIMTNRLFNVNTNNIDIEEYETPKKRVKFDENNLIVSSITYQRQNAMRMQENPKEESIFSKIINFTANLF